MPDSHEDASTVLRSDGPQPLANYPHARWAGPLLFVSGVSSRREDGTHRGATRRSDGGWSLSIGEQTEGVIENLRTILEAAGLALDDLVDVTVFLTDMGQYDAFNAVYNQHFDAQGGPARTTVQVAALPHPNLLVEVKATALRP